ncbi:MAG: DUF1684 domain-containing protein [Gemmatimonadales bacterium]
MSGKRALPHPGLSGIGLGFFLLAGRGSPLAAQVPADLARERADFAEWLTTAVNSPFAAVAMAPLDRGITLGPEDADIPLDGISATRVVPDRSGALLVATAGPRPLPRRRLQPLGGYTIYLGGTPERMVLTVFGPRRLDRPPSYFGYDPGLVFDRPLLRAIPQQLRILALDGIEVEATEVGSVLVPFGVVGTRLRVFRVPDPSEEATELTVYFQDTTNDHGSYPAGRFLALLPLPDGRVRLDFNRARSPFCAYSTVYPCPAPWGGNMIPAAVRAGEQYSGGLE